MHEYNIYGSSRLGVMRDVTFDPPSLTTGFGQSYWQSGHKQYELSNHLGNVMVTISDLKRYDDTEGHYVADVQTATDYFPFGMQMPERNDNA
ncbi:MAG: hypothetical protein GY751_20910, partial [Bacteroidetes bacterium]|nr:hypothetical protein [Bacteroidota bacterium]